MEKAILKTLIYGDLFEYPLKVWEIHRWLIGRKATLFQVEQALKRKSLSSRIRNRGDYFYLYGRKGLVQKRAEKENISEGFYTQVRLVSKILKLIPWIVLVGISGSLAMGNSDKKSDIDLFLVTRKNRLWMTRLCVLSLLGFLGKRRRRTDSTEEAAGKFCVNLLIEEDQLEFRKGDIYLAHEVLQMRVMWDRNGTYARFLDENQWAFKYLPNWTSTYTMNMSLKDYEKQLQKTVVKKNELLDLVEKIFRWLQVRYMGRVSGKERVLSRALFLHPNDMREKVLKDFARKSGSILLKK